MGNYNHRDIEMLKTIKEDEEFKYCTFQPNKGQRLINPDGAEISRKLFVDSQTRHRIKQETLKEEEIHSFKPTINRL
jgi:hypothetical protein